MIIHICFENETGKHERQFNDLELALLCASNLNEPCYIWIDGELWMNIVEYPSGEFEAIIFPSVIENPVTV